MELVLLIRMSRIPENLKFKLETPLRIELNSISQRESDRTDIPSRILMVVSLDSHKAQKFHHFMDMLQAISSQIITGDSLSCPTIFMLARVTILPLKITEEIRG